MQEDKRSNVPAIHRTALPMAGSIVGIDVPAMIAEFGAQGQFAWEEYFSGRIRNPHTRKAYLHAVRRFLAWVESIGVALDQITPGMIGRYFDEHPGSPPTKKMHMSAIRGMFDALVLRHVVILNPALSVATEKFSATEGKTPEITPEQARQLIRSIELDSEVAYRDRAVIGVLVYTAARVGAVAKLRIMDLIDDGTQRALQFHEKGGKQRLIPVRHDLESYLTDYMHAANLQIGAKDSPLFRTAMGRTGLLSERQVTAIDICRMIKRRLKAAALPSRISPHSFRACACTDLLLQGVPMEDVQYLLGHSDPSTTKLYDRRQRQVTRNIVERISV